jgi:PncC family amidohydrolase
MNEGALEYRLGRRLQELKLQLATAESCTGGLIGHRITNAAGSSKYYLGGVVAYANEVKVWLLGLQPEVLEEFGAVSRETVIEMASGVRSALEADIGLAVSGIAGPTGGTPGKPVGLVWIGLSAGGLDFAQSYHLEGDRLQIKEQATERALRLLLDFLDQLATHEQN